MPLEFFFSTLWMSLFFTGIFMSLKSGFFTKSLSDFVILAEWWSAGCNYATKHHLKHSLSTTFWILIRPFVRWSNFFGNWYNCYMLKVCTLKY